MAPPCLPDRSTIPQVAELRGLIMSKLASRPAGGSVSKSVAFGDPAMLRQPSQAAVAGTRPVIVSPSSQPGRGPGWREEVNATPSLVQLQEEHSALHHPPQGGPPLTHTAYNAAGASSAVQAPATTARDVDGEDEVLML